MDFAKKNINIRMVADTELEMVFGQSFDSTHLEYHPYTNFSNITDISKDEFEKAKTTSIEMLESESSFVELWTRSPLKNQQLIRQKQAIRLQNLNRNKPLNCTRPPPGDENASVESYLQPIAPLAYELERQPMKTQPALENPVSCTSSSSLNFIANREHVNRNLRESSQRERSPSRSIEIEPPSTPLCIFKRASLNHACKEAMEVENEGLKGQRCCKEDSNSPILSTKQVYPSEAPDEVTPEHVRPLIVLLWCGAYCFASALQHFYYNYI